MVQIYPLAAGIQLATACIAVGLGVAVIRSQPQKISLPFGMMVLGAAGWSLGSGLGSLLADPKLTYAFGFSIYPFGLLAAIGWWYFTGEFSGKNLLSNRLAAVGAGTLLLVDTIIIATNQSHRLFSDSPATVPASGIIEPVPGPLYWLHMTVTFGILLWGLRFLVAELQQAKGIYAEQTKAIAGGGLFPIAFSLAEVFDVVRVVGLDMGVIGITLSTAVLFYALYYADLLDMVPVQRDTLIENMDQAVVALDGDGRIVDLNPETTATFDVSESDIGTPLEDAFDNVPALVSAISSTTDGTSEIVVDQDTGTHHYSITVSSVTRVEDEQSRWYAPERDLVGQVVVVRDITASRERERRLQQYQTVVKTAGDPIFILDEDGAFELMNDAMVEFLDRPRAELIDTHIGEFFQPKNLDKVMETLAHMGLTGEKKEFKMERTAADGTSRTYEVNMQLIESDSPDIGSVGSVGVIRDVTEHENRKQELDLLGQVLTRVLRHNIRNDIMVVQGYAETLAATLEGQEAKRAEKIVNKADNITALAENARDAKQVLEQTNDREVVALSTVVDDALDVIRQEFPDAPVERDVADWRIEAHPDIQIAVRHVIENAIEHNDSDDPTVEVATSVNETGVTLSVTDDGPGIHEKELDVLEQDKETALSHGSGLGLWVVTWLVEKSGGEISFSNTDSGTEVTMTFEQVAEQPDGTAQPETASSER